MTFAGSCLLGGMNRRICAPPASETMSVNPISWQRLSTEPYLSAAAGTAAPQAVTTPDPLWIDDQLTLLAGAVAAGTERIIRVPLQAADLTRCSGPDLNAASVVLDVGPHDFDCRHVCDPAAIKLGGRIKLFYTAIGNGADCIGQAESHDGLSFVKSDHPVCTGRAPEVVERRGRLYLFHVLKGPRLGYQIHLAISTDLQTFQPVSSAPVVGAGPLDGWDAFEVTTPRIFERNATYFMIYAGGSRPDRSDLPAALGLATSQDLVHWEKYPGNPVFKTGLPGAWDDGALWFGSALQLNESIYLLYEGGRLADLGGPSLGRTQVGLAEFPGTEFDRSMAGW